MNICRAWALVPFIILSACVSQPVKKEELGTRSTPSALIGTWELPCSLENPKSPNGNYVIARDVITEGTLWSRARLYKDAQCLVESNPHKREFRVALRFPGGTTKTSLGAAHHVDEKLLQRIHDGVVSEQGVGTTAYDIVVVDNDRLYYGRPTRGRNGRSSKTRFLELITESPYVRVVRGVK